MKLVLASASPRRADLLRAAGFSFEILPMQIDERFKPREKPAAAVKRLAITKASAAAALRRADVVIGADTTVVVRGQALAKPADPEDARRMLRLLSGRWHEVLTGVCVCSGSRRAAKVETTRVRVARLTQAEMDWYVNSGEPDDKAGAYAVQGLASRFIQGIEGSYSNVVGLPISSLYHLLKELGCDILAF